MAQLLRKGEQYKHFEGNDRRHHQLGDPLIFKNEVPLFLSLKKISPILTKLLLYFCNYNIYYYI